jgi:hypothetical protein
VSEGTLYFHSLPFREDLPVKQTVVLDGMNISDLVTTIASMGYGATLLDESYASRKANVLLEIRDYTLTTTLQAFTSNTWKLLYPLYRILVQAEHDVEKALRQLYLGSATGKWLDYWATFFAIKRDAGESDNDFVRRFMMQLFNPKTNNIAIRELLVYRLKNTGAVDVTDDSPNTFKVTVDPLYFDNSDDLNKFIMDVKAAGVDYFLSFSVSPFTENYLVYLANANGAPIDALAKLVIQTAQQLVEPAFTTPIEELAGTSKATLTDVFSTPMDILGSVSPQKSYSETMNVPTELRSGTTTASVEELITAPVDESVSTPKASLSEAWTAPVELGSRIPLKSLEESAFNLPLETAVSEILQAIEAESWTAPTEELAPSVSGTVAETYLPPQSNLDSCFTLGVSELRVDDIFTGSPADPCAIIITVGAEQQFDVTV